MTPLPALVAAILLNAFAAHAQTLAPLSGQWTGTTKSPSTGNELQIQVRFSESAGGWRYVSPITNRANPCLGREFPLTIKVLSDTKIVVSVDGPAMVTGCPSFLLNLERTDDQTLSGSFADGRPVVLTKK